MVESKVDPDAAKLASSLEVAALTPKLHPSLHYVVEYKEPTLPRHAAFRLKNQLAASSTLDDQTLDTTPPGGQPVIINTSIPLPGLNSLQTPWPTDDAAMAAAAAASEGPHEIPTITDATATDASVSTPPPPFTEDGSSPAEHGADAGPTGARRKLLQTSVRQDVLIVYTAAAATRAGGTEAILAAARNAVALTNKAYVDSGINLQLRLLDIKPVSYRRLFLAPLWAPMRASPSQVVTSCMLPCCNADNGLQ